MTSSRDPLEKFYVQFQKFVENNPNVISAARAAAQIPESAKAVIVLSPYSLQHVFPRKWVSKSYKKNIVERPERLLAASMGIAAAITMYPYLFILKSSDKRLGSLSSPHVTKVHGTKWLRELKNLCKEADIKIAKGEIEVPSTWNANDIYLSSKTLKALKGSIGAIETGIDSIFSDTTGSGLVSNRAFVVIRPPGHHCHVSAPSGFCLLNNVQIAIEYAFDSYDVTHVAVLDFDLHHGDGTQDICWQRAGFKPSGNSESQDVYNGGDGTGDADDDTRSRDSSYDEFGKRKATFPKVGYFSMHDINSFPTESGFAVKENIMNASTCVMNSHDVNIWNVHLAEWSDEEEFMKLYRSRYRTLFAKADEFFENARAQYEQDNIDGSSKHRKPFKGLVVISAGFDASEYEQRTMQRHNVNVPTSFYNIFTKDALRLAQLHCEGKVLSILEGGYSDKALCTGIFSHMIGLQNQDWVDEWGSEQVVKEIVRGCKPNWKPYKTKKRGDVIRTWAEEVIRLGRSMIPEFEDIIFNPDGSAGNVTVDRVIGEPIAYRVTRSYVRKYDKSPEETEDGRLPSRYSQNGNHSLSKKQQQQQQGQSKNIPFVEMELSSEDENDDDYVYDEALNKTFNQTIEDITLDDISRHLETLELIEENEENGDVLPRTSSKYAKPGGGSAYAAQYRLQSGDTSHRRASQTMSRYARVDRNNSKTLEENDRDISMISQASSVRHTTRSGRRW